MSRVIAFVVAAVVVLAAPLTAAHPTTTERSWPADGDTTLILAPQTGAVVSDGTVVRADFVEPVVAVVAWWSRPGDEAVALPVTVAADGLSATLTLPGPLKPALRHRLSVRGTTAAGVAMRQVVDYYGRVGQRTWRGGPPTQVMTGASPVIGKRGRLFTFTIEAQTSLGSHLQGLAQGALRALFDEQRGWTARGRYRIQRVADPRRADIRVLLARPPLVDALCRQVGLNTGGIVSCWNDQFAALNSDRWLTGALIDKFASLQQYQTYLSNHEFGHGLGLHHAECPYRGALAPIMQQQTGGVAGCRPNGWPYPHGR